MSEHDENELAALVLNIKDTYKIERTLNIINQIRDERDKLNKELNLVSFNCYKFLNDYQITYRKLTKLKEHTDKLIRYMRVIKEHSDNFGEDMDGANLDLILVCANKALTEDRKAYPDSKN